MNTPVGEPSRKTGGQFRVPKVFALSNYPRWSWYADQDPTRSSEGPHTMIP
jgi:hypothetical protein